jgi:Ca2+-transporting ATPase
MAEEWHVREWSDVASALKTDVQRGLSLDEVGRRQAEYGPNELTDKGVKSPWRILWEQFTATMVIILIIAALVSALLGKVTESLSIFVIVFLFGILGFVQEYRAERAMAALRQMAAPVVRVKREGNLQEISARELVPGDVIYLEAGNVVPADGRLVETANLRTLESALTGESAPVEKEVRSIEQADAPLGDRHNMLYMGTVVTYGRGAAVVTATGMSAELGKIASQIQTTVFQPTPLQQRLDQVGKVLAVAGVVAAILVMLLGVWRGESWGNMFLAGVSVAVAVVPEGLPAVVTLTLALGARRMLKRRALIRKLPAVETLGAVTVICSDKTGTLTANRMTVVEMLMGDRQVRLDENAPLSEAQQTQLRLLAAGGALCNDAQVGGEEQMVGDPTETALVVAAQKLGLAKDALEKQMPRAGERPFDSERKNMLTLHQNSGNVEWLPDTLQQARYVVIAKGAVDGLLHDADRFWTGESVIPFTQEQHGRIEEMNHRMAEQGMRVLGIAFGEGSTPDVNESSGKGLIFVGMMGMIDPPREEAKAAVNTCRMAGIRPLMITGDHPATALSIALQLGITTNARVLTGQELSKLSDEALQREVEQVSVYARVAPEHKLRVVNALQANRHVVAMTGDGVNDAPALKRADIGVSMGVTGADVTKEASDMVLLDDNFATIVAAVEEGRTIYNNVRRFVQFSVAGNIGKIVVMLAAPLLGMPIPLLPLQLLWLNLMTDGLLGLGMAVEPPERNVMLRRPRSKQDSLFADGVGQSIIWMGTLISLLAIGVGYIYWLQGRDTWQTMVFCTLAFSQVAQAMTVRSDRESIWRIGLFTNRPLLGLTLTVILLQLAVIYLPFTDEFFHVSALTLSDLLVSVACGSVVLLVGEGVKWVRRIGARRLHAVHSAQA